MQFELGDVSNGMEAGRNRCKATIHNFQPSTVAMEQINSIIAEALFKEPTEWPSRAVVLFSEVVTVGGLSRAHFSEEKLTMSVVDEFLRIFGKILNSFTHK